MVMGCLLMGEVGVTRSGSRKIHRYWSKFFLGDEGLNSCRLTLELTRQNAHYICFIIKVSCFNDDAMPIGSEVLSPRKGGVIRCCC